MKKFEIGLSPFITPKEYDLLFSRFAENIDYIYYSVPLGLKFQTRKKLYNGKTIEENIEYLMQVFEVISDYNIKTELCLNTRGLLDEDIYAAMLFTQDILKINPDAIVSLSEYTDSIRRYFPHAYYIYSFNNGIITSNDLVIVPDVYKEIVIVPNALRNKELWNNIIKSSVKVRLLLNNGCSPNCLTCRRPEFCEAFFNSNLVKNGIDYVYATQSLFPSEFKQYIEANPYIDSYKISNRTSDYNYIYNCLSGYITGTDFDGRTDSLYHWCRLGYFSPYYQNNGINLSRVYEIKKELSYPVFDSKTNREQP